MIRVLSILPGNMAVVSTEGLYRVVSENGKVLAELVEQYEAAASIRGYSYCDGLAAAVSYTELAPATCEADAYAAAE
jgi:hypothetical protein